MQVAQHHEEGKPVLVQGDRYVGTGIVESVLTALDRDYRLTVRGTGEWSHCLWRECAPECIQPAISA